MYSKHSITFPNYTTPPSDYYYIPPKHSTLNIFRVVPPTKKNSLTHVIWNCVLNVAAEAKHNKKHGIEQDTILVHVTPLYC